MIKFGTDGWRGVIADEFTIANLKKAAFAISKYFIEKKETSPKKNTIIVGYDNRFLSPESAQIAGGVLSGMGFQVIISSTSVTTPLVSLCIKRKKALGGIMITASHNPYKYNGVKVRSEYGVSLAIDETRKIENYAQNASHVELNISKKPIFEHMSELYVSEIKSKVDINLISGGRLKIAVDPMYGSGSGFMEKILAKTKCRVKSIRAYRDPFFGGIHPEPIEKNLACLIDFVSNEKMDIGVALDGDSDRLGLVDENGRFINSHHIFALSLLHLVKNRKKAGRVVKTISGTYLIDRICKNFNLELTETPIGFKHISSEMLKGGVIVGGEESGGLAFSNFIEERDGIFTALVILEYMAKSKMSLSQLVEDLHKSFGTSNYIRKDIILKDVVNPIDTYEMLKKTYKKHLKKVKEIKDYDGIKFIQPDDSWLLIRLSGTEPVLRIYSESADKSGAVEMHKTALDMLAKIIR